jgi:hypothetical protein
MIEVYCLTSVSPRLMKCHYCRNDVSAGIIDA